LIGTMLLLALMTLAPEVVVPRVAAQGLSVSPVGLTFAPGQTDAVVTLSNRGDVATSFQVRSMVWEQTSRQVVVVAPQRGVATGLIASPPLGTIEPGQTQTIRLLLVQPPRNREATYRLIIDQLPPPESPGQVRLVLRMSLPIFVEPRGSAAADVAWSILATPGAAVLQAHNNGTRHISLTAIHLTSAGRSVTVGADQLPYLLAGASRQWPIAPSLPLRDGARVGITAMTDTHLVLRQVAVVAAP
jgi:fimbrial chaperone protein